MRHLIGFLVAVLPTASRADTVRSTYAQSGEHELGASAGGMLASDLRIVHLSGSIGTYVADHVALSVITGFASIEARDKEKTVLNALVEPAYVPELGPGVHGLLGIGVGAAYVGELGAGVMIAPRLGAKFRVGDRGIVTPSVSYEHIFNNIETSEMDVVVDAALSSLRLGIGYTAFW